MSAVICGWSHQAEKYALPLVLGTNSKKTACPHHDLSGLPRISLQIRSCSFCFQTSLPSQIKGGMGNISKVNWFRVLLLGSGSSIFVQCSIFDQGKVGRYVNNNNSMEAPAFGTVCFRMIFLLPCTLLLSTENFTFSASIHVKPYKDTFKVYPLQPSKGLLPPTTMSFLPSWPTSLHIPPEQPWGSSLLTSFIFHT